MKKILTPEQRAKRWALVTKLLAFVVLGLVAAPIVGMAIYGLMGLIAAGLIGGAAITFGPVLGDIAGNWKLKLIKAEAARNPIETLENDQMQKTIELQENLESISKLQAETLSFESEVDAFRREYPDEAPRFTEQLQNMKDLVEEHEHQYQLAYDAVQQFAGEIKKAKAVWKMSLAAATASRSTKDAAAQDFLARIKTETALATIQDAMNTSFAQLQTLRLKNKTTRREIAVPEARPQLKH